MKTHATSFTRRMLLIVSTLFAITLALPSQAEYSHTSVEVGTPGNNHIEVADIFFSNGNVAKFVITPDSGEMQFGEITQAGTQEGFLSMTLYRTNHRLNCLRHSHLMT